MNIYGSWYEAMEAFDQMLDDGPLVEINDTRLNPSEVLKECRPLDYRTYLYDWLDAENPETDEWDDLNLVP